MSTLKERIEKQVEINLILYLINEYNSYPDFTEDTISAEKCRESLKTMELEKIRENTKNLQKLLIQREANNINKEFLEKLTRETERHGIDWVKEKYVINKFEEEE